MSASSPSHDVEENPLAGLPPSTRIAIVDDDAACRTALASVLRRLGIECETHASVSLLIHSHALKRVHCVLLDIMMPEIDGLTAQRTLQHTNFDVPIILCSALHEEQVRQMAHGHPVAFFLRKPIHRQNLIEALHQTLCRPKRRAAKPRKKKA